jgi:hypothetical protein
MRELFARSITAKLHDLTARLHSLDRGLKLNPPLDGLALLEFRHALDNVRMTAWTVTELLNARQSQKNPQAVISFLTAERLRRFGQMARDPHRFRTQKALPGPSRPSTISKTPLLSCASS